VTQIYEIRIEIGNPFLIKSGRSNNIRISAQFQATSRLDDEYRWKATGKRQSENGVANC